MKSTNNNLLFTTANSVSEIAKSFFSTFQLSFYSYSRCYPENKLCFNLNSNMKLLDYHLENKHPLAESSPFIGIRLWESFIPANAISDLANYFDCHNGIVLCRANTKENYIEYAHFASSKAKQSPFEFYLNNINLLEQFILYFKDKASAMINQAYNKRLSLPIEETAYDKAIKLITARPANLNSLPTNGLLTKRECEIILLLAEYKYPKEIANDLNISPRTVELHIAHAKQKTQCYTKSQLIKIVKKHLFTAKFAEE